MYTNKDEEPDIVNGLQEELQNLRKQIHKERELLDYSFLLQNIIKVSPYPMWIADEKGTMQKANNALLKTLNLTEADLIGKYNVLEDNNLKKDNLIAEVEKVFTEHRSVTIVLSWGGDESNIDELANASKVWIEASIFPILNPNGVLTNIVCQWFNITRQKNAEMILEKQKVRLEELVMERTGELAKKNVEIEATAQRLNEVQNQMMQSEKMASLGFLTASIAHDLNNPLSYMRTAHSFLKETFKEQGKLSGEDTEKILGIIDSALENSIKIVKSLNLFSRDNLNRNEHFNINEVLEDCLIMLQAKLKKGITVEKNYCNDMTIIIGNSGQFHQVFLNILTNATQAIQGKGKITIGTCCSDNEIVIKVTDSGCGIPDEKLPKVLEPFFTTKPPGEGTGLGLAISNKIILEHGGTLDLSSQAGRGTTVSVKLPVS